MAGRYGSHRPVDATLWEAFWMDRCGRTRAAIAEQCGWLADAAAAIVYRVDNVGVRQDLDLDDLRGATDAALLAAVDRYQPGGPPFEGYVWRRLVGAARDEVRRMTWHRREQKDLGRCQTSLAATTRNGQVVADFMDDGSDEVGDMVDRLGEHQALERGMAGLTAAHVEALRLYYGDGLTLADAGTRMGITESGACVRVQRAVQELRRTVVPLLEGDAA